MGPKPIIVLQKAPLFPCGAWNGTRAEILTARDTRHQAATFWPNHHQRGTCSTTEAPPLHRHATFFAALVGDPPEDYNSFRRIQNKARFNSTVEPKTDETIDLEKTRSTIRRTSIIFDRSKILYRISDRESIGQWKSKSVDRELITGSNRRGTGERTVLSEPPLSRRRGPAESVLWTPPFPGNRADDSGIKGTPLLRITLTNRRRDC